MAYCCYCSLVRRDARPQAGLCAVAPYSGAVAGCQLQTDGRTLVTSVLSRAVKPRACQMVTRLRLYVHKMEETCARMYT
jgi:hypothetical protein